MNEDRKELVIKYLNKIYTTIVFYRDEVAHRDGDECLGEINARDMDLADTLESYVSIIRGPCYDNVFDDNLHSLTDTLNDEIAEHELIINGLKQQAHDTSKKIWQFTQRKAELIRMYDKAWESIRSEIEEKRKENQKAKNEKKEDVVGNMIKVFNKKMEKIKND